MGGIALDELSLYEVGGMVDVGRDSGGGWAVEAWLVVDGIGLIGKPVSYLSMIDLTISKQVSWRSWATSSVSLGLLGTRWVIKLSMALVMRSGAMTASSQAT